MSTSLIPLYIICTAIHYDETGQELTFKKLYLVMDKYSDVGIKNHLKTLSRKGWLEVTRSSLDGRVKCIKATQKIKTVFEKVINF